MEIAEHFIVNPNNFPGKLWLLVNDPQIRSVGWDASGEEILIHQLSFQAEVLLSHTKKYFKTTDFTSFVRQMNLYGFRKVRSNISEGIFGRSFYMPQLHRFHNPYFKRDRPELLVNLRRLTTANKAKLVDGMEPTSFSSEQVHQVMLNSPQEETVINNGSVVVEHQRTLYLHSNAPQQGLDETPSTSQAFVMGHNEPCPVTLGSTKAVPVPVFHHFLIDSPSARGAMPHHPLYGFNTPVYHTFSPNSLNSNVPHSPHLAASSAHHGYNPDLDTVIPLIKIQTWRQI